MLERTAASTPDQDYILKLPLPARTNIWKTPKTQDNITLGLNYSSQNYNISIPVSGLKEDNYRFCLGLLNFYDVTINNSHIK